jgi:hypothetical protein
MEINTPQSFNRYTYVNNNPVNAVDPLGLSMKDVTEAEQRHDGMVEEARALKAFNDAFARGDLAACRAILAANPSVGYEENSSYNPNARGDDGEDEETDGKNGSEQQGLQSSQNSSETDGEAASHSNNETGYKTADAAARAALNAINATSIKENLEYAGLIYRDINTGLYHYSTAVQGTKQYSWPYNSPVPKGTVVVGDYHTHGDYSIKKNGKITRTSDPKRDNLNSDHFSRRDKRLTEGDARDYPGYKSYLGTPSGVFRGYDPGAEPGKREWIL